MFLDLISKIDPVSAFHDKRGVSLLIIFIPSKTYNVSGRIV